LLSCSAQKSGDIVDFSMSIWHSFKARSCRGNSAIASLSSAYASQ
jgi:hypothetical protein